MPKFQVEEISTVRNVWEVEARTEEEAKEKAFSFSQDAIKTASNESIDTITIEVTALN